MESLLIALIVVVVVAAFVGSLYLKQKRREALAAMAGQLGLTYSKEDNYGCLSLPFGLLRRGDDRGAEDLLHGSWEGMEVREFDYWYEVESTDSNGNRTTSTYRFSCAVTDVEAMLSPLTLGRENVFTRLADSIGLADVEFELEDFNRAFTVKCKDRKFANDFVDQRMMRWLLGTDRGFSFEACGRWLLVYSKRRRPTELIPLLGTLKQFREGIPPVVFDLYGLRPSG
ncbi:MAG: hypothetical protein ACRDGW_07635 [Actinomycetota bacterium]